MDCDLALMHQLHHCLALIGQVIILGLAARSNGTISSVPQNSDLAYVGRIHYLAPNQQGDIILARNIGNSHVSQ